MASTTATSSMSPTEIRNVVKSDNLVIGTEETIKLLKTSSLQQVLVSSNCSDAVREDVLHYANLAQTPVEELHVTNQELGVMCKKPYSISVLSIRKGN